MQKTTIWLLAQPLSQRNSASSMNGPRWSTSWAGFRRKDFPKSFDYSSCYAIDRWRQTPERVGPPSHTTERAHDSQAKALSSWSQQVDSPPPAPVGLGKSSRVSVIKGRWTFEGQSGERRQVVHL